MGQQINTNLLLALASSQIATDAARFNTQVVGNGSAFADKLKEEAKKRTDMDETAAAGQILDTIKIKNALVLANVQRVAVLNKEIANLEANSQTLATAEAYGFETRNFLPLAILSGQSVPVGAEKELLSFPKGWAPSATEVTDTPAATTPAATSA